MMRVWRLSLSCTSGLSREPRGLWRLKKAQRHTRLGHHYQGQKVEGQLAGGGGILWRPPAQLVIFFCFRCVVYVHHPLPQVRKCNNVRHLYELPDLWPLNSPDHNTIMTIKSWRQRVYHRVGRHFFKTQPNPKFQDPTQPNPTHHRHLVWLIRLYRKLYTTTVTRHRQDRQTFYVPTVNENYYSAAVFINR